MTAKSAITEIPFFEVKDDTLIYRYGMTIKELREEIQYKIASVNVRYEPTIQMSSGDSSDGEDEIIEENEQIDTDEWEINLAGNPLYRQPQDWSKWFSLAPEDIEGTGHMPTEWTDEENKSPYTTKWAKDVVESIKPKCEHKFTRDVELIFTVATECIDCGERLK